MKPERVRGVIFAIVMLLLSCGAGCCPGLAASAAYKRFAKGKTLWEGGLCLPDQNQITGSPEKAELSLGPAAP